MKICTSLAAIGTIITLGSTGYSATGPVFYGDPPDEHHAWAVHDGNRPQPKIVTPGTFSTPDQAGKAPSDAIILFDGTDLSKWESGNGSEAKWLVQEGFMQAKPGSGDIHTKEKFGDCQLHIEWAAPAKVEGSDQGRGNSGIFLMGVEIQVLDSYNNITYADGHAASIYSVMPPMANALRPPGEFQVYDIVFRHPIYDGDKVLDPGYVTVFVNGVLAQDHTMIEGHTGHRGRAKPGPFPAKDSLNLQDHGNPVRYRNIWYRELSLRPIQGGTDGYLTTEATMAKRKQLAATIRENAATMQDPMRQMYRLLESLEYEKDDAAYQKAEQMANQYVAGLKEMPADKLAAKKDEGKHFRDVMKWLADWKIVPANFAPKTEIEQIIKDQGWDKKK